MTLPETFLTSEGEYFLSDNEKSDHKVQKPHAEQHLLKGTGACGGQVLGRAAVLRDITEMHNLSMGDVLITRQTDPGWAPVFYLAKGLVMERGGMLSHGAIVARELGIPTVVGVRDVTQKVSSGQTLWIDGDSGYVQIRD